MSGDTEMDDPEMSDGASGNEDSEHEHEQEIGKEDDDTMDMADQTSQPDINENGNTVGSGGATKPKFDPKDPLRPRRKKARRACFACQRAHLTCGMLFPFRLALPRAIQALPVILYI